MTRHLADLIRIYQDMARVQAAQALSYRLRDMWQNAELYSWHSRQYAGIARALLFAYLDGDVK